MDRITYIIIYPYLYLISRMPFNILYVFSDVACFFIYRIIRYRRNIVRSNLITAFPKVNISKIKEIEKKFYSHLKNINLNLEKSKVILIRNEPPFDNRYLYTTFLLNHISKKVKIINHPFAVRNISEKLFSIKMLNVLTTTLLFIVPPYCG